MIHSIKELSSEQKVVIEALLGRQVADGEAVSIRAVVQPPASPERRREIAAELEKYFAEIDANGQKLPAEDAEDILAEAMRSVRPGYRSRS